MASLQGFYKAVWTIIGPEVTNAITLFFQTSTLPKATNSTILTLLPKFPGASIIKDYRPISCCNTLYKVISKLLVARLKPLLPSIILPNQTAFIQGRLLAENCLLASEIVSGYHNQRSQKKLTLKIDIAKAFDSVRWDYLQAYASRHSTCLAITFNGSHPATHHQLSQWVSMGDCMVSSTAQEVSAKETLYLLSCLE